MITPEQVVAVLGAVTALIVALLAVYSKVAATHDLVNSRMTELLELTRKNATSVALHGPDTPQA